MMKKIAKLTCTFAVISAALFTLTGCSNTDPVSYTHLTLPTILLV